RANVLLNGYAELKTVFRQVRKSFTLSFYLVGFFFMIMGLITIMFMATSYGEKQLHLKAGVLIPTLLGIQLVGMFGAWLFAWLSGKFGNLRALILSIIIWVFTCLGAYYITDAAGYMTAAFFIGLVMGGSQSLARSTYSKMLPETTDHTSFFSFYDVMEKVATVAGLFTFGIIEAITGTMRNSVLAIALFFILSLVFFLVSSGKGLIRRYTP
ncbi:MAG TPA: MFS transporter, partial [Bacteroidales bacterium]|nr:MFS transporter [Bacteroidales bacterium]